MDRNAKIHKRTLYKACRTDRTFKGDKVSIDMQIIRKLDRTFYNSYRVWLILDCSRTHDSKVVINKELQELLNVSKSHLYKVLNKGNNTFWIVCKSKETRQGFIVLKSRKGVLQTLGINKETSYRIKRVSTSRKHLKTLATFNNLIVYIYSEIKNKGTYNSQTQEHSCTINNYNLVVSGKSYERIANKTKFSYSKVSKTLNKHKGKVKRYERVNIGNKTTFKGIREARNYIKKVVNSCDYLEWITHNGKQGIFIKKVGGKIGKEIDTTQYILARRIANEFKQRYIIETKSVVAPSSRRNDLISAFSDTNKGICYNANIQSLTT